MSTTPSIPEQHADSFPNPFHHASPTVTIVTVTANDLPKLSAMASSATGTTITTSTTVVIVPKEGFWASISAWFERLFGSAAKWEQIASSTLTLTAPLIVALSDAVGGTAAGTAVAAILSAIQTDMATAGTLVSQAAATATLAGALNAIQTNLQALLQEVQVVNPESVQNATAIVNLIVAEIEAIQKELPAAATAGSTSAS